MPRAVKKSPTKMTSGRKNGGRKEECSYKNLDMPAEVALYYGFTPIDPPRITKEDAKKARAFSAPENSRGKESSDLPRFAIEEKIALLRLYHEGNMYNAPQPVMLYCGKPILPEGLERKNAGKERTALLEIMGTSKSIAEVLLIKTCLEILKEEGFGNISVR